MKENLFSQLFSGFRAFHPTPGPSPENRRGGKTRLFLSPSPYFKGGPGRRFGWGGVKWDSLFHTFIVLSSLICILTLLALTPPGYWHPPADSRIPAGELGKQIRYGRELIAHTAKYLGPKGTVKKLSNGMNCQNCHLDAGTKVLGNNYSGVFSTYPKFRDRSGAIETIVKRVSDCFERSLAGKAPDSTSREMKAIVAYMQWLGTDVPKGQRPEGVGLVKLNYLDRAADSTKGRLVYVAKCQVCHGAKGEGMKMAGSTEYVYPPMWGPNSYNDGAGLFRLSGFAGYVKNNMPFGATYESPQLSDEEAWDVAAFVNSMPRPHKDQSSDWPKVATKPIDFPFGPYADSFTEQQHKFGPYQPIVDARKAK